MFQISGCFWIDVLQISAEVWSTPGPKCFGWGVWNRYFYHFYLCCDWITDKRHFRVEQSVLSHPLEVTISLGREGLVTETVVIAVLGTWRLTCSHLDLGRLDQGQKQVPPSASQVSDQSLHIIRSPAAHTQTSQTQILTVAFAQGRTRVIEIAYGELEVTGTEKKYLGEKAGVRLSSAEQPSSS